MAQGKGRAGLRLVTSDQFSAYVSMVAKIDLTFVQYETKSHKKVTRHYIGVPKKFDDAVLFAESVTHLNPYTAEKSQSFYYLDHAIVLEKVSGG